MFRKNRKRSNSFPSGQRHKADLFRATIPFPHIRVQGIPLKEYLKEHRATERDVTILPCHLESDNALFYLSLHNKPVPIRSSDIEHYDTFCYWLGVSGDKNPEEIIRKQGKWSTIVFNEKKLFYVECKITRTSPYHFRNNSLFYFPMGWHNVLPIDILQEAKDNHWRIKVAPIEECCNPNNDDMDLYGTNGFVHCLTNIPVRFYSVQKDSVKLEKTVEVDIRSFRNMQLFFEYQKQRFDEMACLSLLDLFDAMLAMRARWHIDASNELIYLPCIRRPPERFYRVLEVHRSQKNSSSYEAVTGSEHFLNHTRDMFPLSCEDVSPEKLREETVMRMKSTGAWPKGFGSEKGVIAEKNWIFYIVPSVLTYKAWGAKNKRRNGAEVV